MIIWFSGSGNSLAYARKIADRLGEQMVPLYEAIRMDLSSEKRIGLVYPTYWLDAPLAIKELVPRLKLPKDAYTFIVITCGAQTNNAVWTVRHILRKQGVKLDYCHKIRVPDTSAIAFGRNPNEQVWKFEKYAPRLEKIIADVLAGKKGLHFSGFDPLGWLLNTKAISGSAYKLTLPAVNADKCIGCGICSKVCPQSNITLTDKKATIGDRCTMCLGCLHNCPQQAVEIAGKPTCKEHQYRHPDIKTKDFFVNLPKLKVYSMATYERINLDDYIQSGEGGESLTYTRKDGKAMAKLFLKSYGADTAEREFRISQAVYKLGIPSPEPFRLVTDGERFGGEYEVIANKRSYTRIISEEPDQLEPLTAKFAALAKGLHSTPADTDAFPEMSAIIRPWIEKAECITEPLRARLLSALDTIPNPKTCLHGDLHIGNIITNGVKDYWIDLGSFAWGCPEWDFSMCYYVSHYVPAEWTDRLFHLDPATLRRHWDLLLKDYYGFKTAEEQSAYEKNLLKFTALKYCYITCKRYGGKGEPSPQREALVNAFLSGIAPGV